MIPMVKGAKISETPEGLYFFPDDHMLRHHFPQYIAHVKNVGNRNFMAIKF